MTLKEYKDVFGELQFELGNYFVPHRTGCTGQYAILKREAWYVTDAYIVYEGILIERCPRFDSWIQAIRFLKENIEDLL